MSSSNKSTASQMTRISVAIAGTAVVPLMSSVLDNLADLGLQEEIACEAVKLSLSERMGGFDNIEIAPYLPVALKGKAVGRSADVPKYTATINFNGLCVCIESMQAEYERIVGLAQEMAESLSKLDTSDTQAMRDAIAHLAQTAAQMITPPQSTPSVASHGVEPPPLISALHTAGDGMEAATEGIGRPDYCSDDSDERARSCDEGGAEAMGYQRLLDDNDEDDETVRDMGTAYKMPAAREHAALEKENDAPA